MAESKLKLAADQPDDNRVIHTLRPADAAAFDALLEARLTSTAAPATTPSLDRLAALLDLAAAEPASAADEAPLVAQTLARIAQARQDGEPLATPCTLCPDDAVALDAVLTGEPAVDSLDPARIAAVRRLLHLVSASDPTTKAGAWQDPANNPRSTFAFPPSPTPADEALIQRTLDAAADERQKERFARQVALFADPPRGIGVGWRQIAAAAAVLFLGFSLLMPALANQRQQARQVACATNLSIAGQQMGAYAADFAGMLPRGPVGQSWLKAGQPDAVDAQGRYQSNSAHLYLLIKESYLAPEQLTCAGNQYARAVGNTVVGQVDWDNPQAISYSYQNQYGALPIRVDRARPTLAVLADKNPLFVVRAGRLEFDAGASRNARSALHGRLGQNVLFLDGGVRWTKAPQVEDDNLWQINGHEGRYLGHEAPSNPLADSFLVP